MKRKNVRMNISNNEDKNIDYLTQKWGFDFTTSTPLHEGPYEWYVISSQSLPHNISSTLTSLSSMSPEFPSPTSIQSGFVLSPVLKPQFKLCNSNEISSNQPSQALFDVPSKFHNISDQLKQQKNFLPLKILMQKRRNPQRKLSFELNNPRTPLSPINNKINTPYKNISILDPRFEIPKKFNAKVVNSNKSIVAMKKKKMKYTKIKLITGYYKLLYFIIQYDFNKFIH